MTLRQKPALRRSRRWISTAALAAVTLPSQAALATEVGPWGPLINLRDDTNTHTGNKPAGGWYVTPIHVVLRARDGKVVVSGTGRIGQSSCDGTTQRG